MGEGDSLEDIVDRRSVGDAEGQELVPAEVVDRLIDGEHPLRVWREYRDMTQKRLGAKAGFSDGYIAAIESGKKEGSLKALRALARALDVDLDDILPDA